MQDRRYVHLLLHTEQGEFLVLKQTDPTQPLVPRRVLLSSEVLAGDTDDYAALDRGVMNAVDLVLNTEDALQIGFDAEYEPGEGMVTQVLYMLKIATDRPFLRLDANYAGFDWVRKDDLRGFTPPLQVLVQVAVDFYL